MAEESAQGVPELESEPTTHAARAARRTRRVHIVVYEEDWQKLGLFYPDSIKRSSVIRSLLHAYVAKIEGEAERRRGRSATGAQHD